jgi:hypothetical protein
MPSLAAVGTDQLVAEVQGGRSAVNPLADVVKAQTQMLGHAQQPLEVRRPEAEGAAIDGALGADQVGVAFAVLVYRRGSVLVVAAGLVVDHAQLVEQDFLGGPGLFQARRVNHPGQRGLEKLVGEDRKLLDEKPQLVVGGLPGGKPARVRVVVDDSMREQLTLDLGQETGERIDLCLRQLSGREACFDPGRDAQANPGMRCSGGGHVYPLLSLGIEVS